MKNKIIYSVVLLAVAGLAAINMSINTRGNDLSDVSLANVEALANEINEIIYCRPAYIWVCEWSVPLYGEPIPLN
jgi:hypothetical protein